MRTSFVDDGRGLPVCVHHNGDWSGDVEIAVSPDQIEKVEGACFVSLPVALLLELVGRVAKAEHVSRIEGMTGRQFIQRGGGHA